MIVSTKLTNSQRIVLSARAAHGWGGDAARTDDGEAAQKLAATLSEKGLVREVRAKADMPVWRRNERDAPTPEISTRVIGLIPLTRSDPYELTARLGAR